MDETIVVRAAVLTVVIVALQTLPADDHLVIRLHSRRTGVLSNVSPVAVILSVGLPALWAIDGTLSLGRYVLIAVVSLVLAAVVERVRRSPRLRRDRARWGNAMALSQAAASTWLIGATVQLSRGASVVDATSLRWAVFFAVSYLIARRGADLRWPPFDADEPAAGHLGQRTS